MMKKISLILLITLVACGSHSCNNDDSVGFPLQLKFSGIGSRGIFDPSVTLDTSTGTLWMSYTEVHPSVMWPDANPFVAGIRLAYSTDRGKSWTDSGIYLNQAYDVTVTTPDPDIKEGTWNNEVSQILYDPWETDPDKKWKLIWHHYLLLDHVTLTAVSLESRLFQHGWIGLKEASSPSGLASATEVKLFSASSYDSENDNPSGNTKSPVGGPPAIEYHTMTGADSFVITEPGLLAAEEGIYMSLLSIDSTGNNHNIHIVKYSRSGDIENSGSWTYSGTALTTADAGSLGYNTFSATELFENNGSTYLLVSPVSNDPWANAYHGCMTFRFADLNSALLEGSLAPVNYVQGDEGSFNGACECHSSLSYGFIYGQVYPAETETFRLYHSGILPY